MKKMILTVILMASLLTGIHSTAVAQQQSKGTVTGSRAGIITDTIAGYRYNKKNFDNNSNLKSKEVSKETAVPADGTIYIENASRNIVVKTWAQQKVKVTTTLYYDGESKLTEEQWLEKVNLSLKTLGKSVKIKSGTIPFTTNNGSGTYTISGGTLTGSGSSIGQGSSTNNLVAGTLISGGGSGIAVFDGNGQNIGTKNNMKRVVTVTVPEGSKLDIESKYADVSLPAKLGDINADITNGNLEGENINRLIIHSKYGNINVVDVKTAEIQLFNGRFSANNIDDLDIETRSSSVEVGTVKKMAMNSSNDEYELEEAGEIHGKKDFGSLRITKLNSSIEMNGSSADIKIRNLGPLVNLIKIDDRFANIRIPMNKTKNYEVDFTGTYSSVYGNFEKKELAGYAEPTITTVGTLNSTNRNNGFVRNGSGINQDVYTNNDASVTTVSGSVRPATIKSETIAGTVTPAGTRVLVDGSRITSLGNLTAISVNGVAIATDAVGRSNQNITTAGTLTALTVAGYITAASAYRTEPGVVTEGSLSNLTVVGYATTPVYRTESGMTTTGMTNITTLGNPSSLTVTGRITGGTFSGILSSGTYNGIIGNPSATYRGGQQMVNGMLVENVRLSPDTNNTPPRFTATIGDGKGLKIAIKCPNCTVDFK